MTKYQRYSNLSKASLTVIFNSLLQDEDSDPEDEGEEEEAPGDDGGDGDDDDDEDEEELEDPLEKVRDACGEHAECTKLKNDLELCNQRVSSRSNTEETCVQELFDFLECQDKCVSRLYCNLLSFF